MSIEGPTYATTVQQYPTMTSAVLSDDPSTSSNTQPNHSNQPKPWSNQSEGHSAEQHGGQSIAHRAGIGLVIPVQPTTTMPKGLSADQPDGHTIAHKAENGPQIGHDKAITVGICFSFQWEAN